MDDNDNYCWIKKRVWLNGVKDKKVLGYIIVARDK